MSDPRPLTRSRSKKSNIDRDVKAGWNPTDVPPPLHIRKANALRDLPPPQYQNGVAIGVAVGSPKDSPLPPLPKNQITDRAAFHFPTQNGGSAPPSADESRYSRDSKTKGIKWKTFGGLFGKKEPSNKVDAAPVYHAAPLKPEVQAATIRTAQASRKRAGSDKEKATELQNLSDASQMKRRPSLIRRASSKRKAAQRRKPSQARVERRSARNSTVYGPNAGVQRVNVRQQSIYGKQLDFSLMQIEIPNVEMERYSVMFDNVLRGSPNASRTSLTRPARTRTPDSRSGSTRPVMPRKDSEGPRRGRAERPETANDELPQPPEMHKREGSTSSTSSASKPPSFSLFPATSSSCGGSPARTAGNKPLPRPSPLRSMTATAIDNTDKLPRPPLKLVPSDSIIQPIPVAPGKENIPLSKWNATHSRQGSHASSNSQDRPPSQGHVAQLDTNYHRRSHSRNLSLEPPDLQASSSQHRPQASNASSKYLDVSEFSSTNTTLAGPAVRPPSPESHPHPLRSAKHTKQTFMNRAFPARKSSLKRLPQASNGQPTKPSPLNQPVTHNRPHTPPSAPTSTPDTTDPIDTLPPQPHFATSNPTPQNKPAPSSASFSSPFSHHASTESTSSTAEVSIARQISISRRQRQHLIPVVAGAKTARQPMQAVVVDAEEMARRSELVFVESGDVSPGVDAADAWNGR